MGIMDQNGALATKFKSTKALGQNRNFDKFGRYLMRLDAVRLGNSFRQGGEYVAIERTVVRCLEAPPNLPTSYVGEEVVDLLLSTGAAAKVFDQKLKGFLCAVLNAPAEAIGFEELQACLAEAQPLKNLLIEVNNAPRIVKVKSGAMEERPQKAYVKGYSFKEAKAILTPEEVAKFYPNGLLDKLVAAEG
ncbi:MAG: hypothetical protein IT371_30440 [Deltaproteobacteria bacterium]|nr:hypothetical protein [Deltaproteobacteria bacterium]